MMTQERTKYFHTPVRVLSLKVDMVGGYFPGEVLLKLDFEGLVGVSYTKETGGLQGELEVSRNGCHGLDQAKLLQVFQALFKLYPLGAVDSQESTFGGEMIHHILCLEISPSSCRVKSGVGKMRLEVGILIERFFPAIHTLLIFEAHPASRVHTDPLSYPILKLVLCSRLSYSICKSRVLPSTL